MKLSEAFPSRFLKAEDLDVPVTDKILDVRQELVGDDSKIVAHFVKNKPLVCNKTNARMMASLAGSDDTDDWNGTLVELYRATTEFKGTTVPCVRVRAPRVTKETHPLPPEHEADAPLVPGEPTL